MHRPLAPLALAAVLLAPALHAQQTHFDDPANLGGERIAPRTGRELPIDGGEGDRSLGLAQMLRRLQTRASILNIVAHPDDEDGGMLTFYARGMGARVADLSLTRGEGGQNAMTGDFEDALGLLRTQELLANDRYVGVTQFFGTEADFGFSKTKAEAFSKWTHERCLYDAVRAIRIFRPLIITSTWVGAPTDGHGQHQVSGEIAQEAFVAAGDPKVFPELTAEGILPWQPLKMYARVPRGAINGKGLYDYATNQIVPAEFTDYITHETSSTPPTTDVIVHEGQTDPLLTVVAAHRSDLPKSLANSTEPMSYVQFARIGLSLQKSQVGPGDRTAGPGVYDVLYHRFGSKLANQPGHEEDFFTGIDTSIRGIADEISTHHFAPLDHMLEELQAKIEAANRGFNPNHPESIATQLADGVAAADAAISAVNEMTLGSSTAKADVLHELRIKRNQLNDALALSLGLSFDATTHGADQITETITPVHVELHQKSTTDITLVDEHLEDLREHKVKADDLTEERSVLAADHPIINTIRPDLAITASVTRPYFTRKNIEDPVYTLSEAALRNAPATPPAITAYATVAYKGVSIDLAHVVHDSGQALSFIPAASVSFSAHAQILPSSERSILVHTYVNPPQSPKLAVKLTAPHGWKAQLATNNTDVPNETTFQIMVPQQQEPVVVQANVTLKDKREAHEGYRAVGYGDLPRTNIFEPATLRIVPADLKLPTKRRIAFVPGTGDAVPEALASIGLPVTTVKVSELNAATLANYDTVILGVRTYNAHPDLHGASTQALLDFARAGGNVIVEYQTPEFTAADAPYPLNLGENAKVVDETAPVKLLDTQNPLLTKPNKLSPTDFNGWIEERGHGFMETWDPHYTALTETGDPGSPAEHVQPQKPQRGGLLTVQLGKGRWTYLAFAVYRQLPEAVPGAYRLMMNLLDGR